MGKADGKMRMANASEKMCVGKADAEKMRKAKRK